MALHGLAEVDGGAQVIAVVLQGLLHGFAHCLVAGEVNDSVNILQIEEFAHAVIVPQIQVVEFGTLSGDLLDAVHHHLLGIVEIVGDDDIVACIQKLHTGVASDKTGSSGDKYLHSIIPPAVNLLYE